MLRERLFNGERVVVGWQRWEKSLENEEKRLEEKEQSIAAASL